MRKFIPGTLILIAMIAMQSCKEKQTETNPFFTEWKTPFGVPPFDQIRNEHFKPAIEEGIKRHEAEIDAIVNSTEVPTFENVILAMDRAGEFLNRVNSVFFGLNSANSNDTLRQIDREVSPLLSAHSDKITFNDKLFDKIKAVYENRENLGFDEQQMRLVDKTYKRFVRAGALLSAEQKDELGKINEQLTKLSVEFSNNVLAETKNFVLVIDNPDDLDGLSESIRNAAAEEAGKRGMEGKWVFNLSKPSWIPFLTNSNRRDLREKLYKGYLDRGNNGNENDNKQIINDMVKLRLQKANLLGYPTYAAYVLENAMAKTPDNVYAFLDKLWGPSLKLASTELNDMRKIKLAETGNDRFESWDWWYYAEKVRKAKYDLDEEMLSPYFSLSQVQAGIFELCNRLYGITFRPVNLPVYHPDCTTYEVLDQDNSHLGILYFDFHPRAGAKNNGAWCGRYRGQSYENGKRVAPVVTIVCNFTPPADGTPSLLSLDEVETFFHEFGHGLHGLFADVRYKGIGSTERDFVELPSQIMENWAFEPAMLKLYARHYQTNEIIPDALIAKIQNSGLFNQGFMTTELLAASLLDMDVHSLTAFAPFDVMAFERKALNEKRGLMSEIEPRYHLPYFMHIFSGGYAVGYYGYIWAEVLDKDAFDTFVESGDLFNKQIAKSFRDNILSRGGIEDGMVMYEKFRGRQPDITSLMLNRGLMAPPANDGMAK